MDASLKKCQVWLGSLLALPDNGRFLQNALEMTISVLDNPLSIMDEGFTFYASTIDADEIGAVYSAPPLDDAGRMPVEIINHFRNDSSYDRTVLATAPYVYTFEQSSVKVLCANLFKTGEPIGRLLVHEVERPFLENDYSYLAILRDVIQRPFIAFRDELRNTTVADELLRELLSGDANRFPLLLRLLRQRGWKQHDAYIVARIRLSDRDRRIRSLQFFTNDLNNSYDHVFIATSLRDDIACIARYSDLAGGVAEAITMLTGFAEKNGFTLGISHSFRDFERVLHYWKQAGIAMDLGNRLNPGNCRHLFVDYAVEHMWHRATSEFDEEALIAPEVLELQAYDQTHDGSYLQTLNVYLNNDMNASLTARILNIQRATLLFRLKRITEISQLDFQNQERLLHVRISLQSKLLQNQQA